MQVWPAKHSRAGGGAGKDRVAVRDKEEFFSDPFFQDWWTDFDTPLAALATSAPESGRRELSPKNVVRIFQF